MDKHEIPQPQRGPSPAEDIIRRFSHHPPRNQDDIQLHAAVRGEFMQLAHNLTAMCPPGRELSLVLTKLEEAMFWANAAIARGRADG